MTNGNQRPWFGPKRVGWGIRPQTWQGWAISALIAVVIVVLPLLIH
jgi:ABC-type dipeptide/oligopeptide/nickel transport system permease subunit